MKKLLRPQDMLLLGLTNVLDVFEEFKDPLGMVGRSYEQMYGFTPSKYKKHNFNHLIWRSLKTGYIEKIVKDGTPYLRLTSFGKKRLKRDFPLFNIQDKKWDRKWRIVTFDIEEVNSNLRKKFRGKLKELGFGMLQESVFISPNDIAKDFAEFVEEQELNEFVYVMEVSNIMCGDVKSLSNKIWRLERLNESYVKIFSRLKKIHLTLNTGRAIKLKDVKDKEKIISHIKEIRKEYLEVLLSDPFLPKELLPESWAGEKVRTLMKNLEKIKL